MSSMAPTSALPVACRIALALPLLLLPIGAGCSKGPNLQKVSGKILVDGEPAAGANLLFFTPGQRGGTVPSANAGPDGGFQIISNAKEGVLPGSYTVTVVWPEPAKAAKAAFSNNSGSAKDDPPDLLGGKYVSPTASPLKVEITPGMKELPPIEISKK